VRPPEEGAALSGAGEGWREHELHSSLLAGNPLGDPAARPLFVWTPPGYAQQPTSRYPAVYVLHAMTSQARAHFNVSPFAASLAAQIAEASPAAIVVLVDGFTALGGAQWLDSPATGRYGSYLCEEVVGFVDASYRTLPSAAHRGLAGTSSGGFGAAVWSMLRPDLFGGFASHAGDCLFDVTLRAELAPAAQALRNLYGGSFAAFWSDFRSGRPVLEQTSDALLQNLYATAAAFSPRPDGSVELPCSLETGEVVPEVWERWLAWDPVRLAERHGEALRGLRAVWLDAGRRDDYRLDLGATALTAALLRAGLKESSLHFELFEGSHRGLSRRLPLSLVYLAGRLAP
jgi:S-formylglutathione hydrolase FrmB